MSSSRPNSTHTIWSLCALAVAFAPFVFATGCPSDSIGVVDDTGVSDPSSSSNNPEAPNPSPTSHPDAATTTMPATHPDAAMNPPPHDGGGMHDTGAPQEDSGTMGGTPDTGTEASDTGASGGADTGTTGGADSGTTGADSGTTSGTVPFGGTCTVDANCTTGFICRPFGQLGNVCTKTCTVNTDCPVGSQGQKCNQMGLCRP